MSAASAPTPSAPASLSRATVVRGLAWSAPVVATVVAAPLAAASPWASHTVTFARTSQTTARGTGTAAAPTAPKDAITVSSALTGDRKHQAANFTVSSDAKTLTLASQGASYTSSQVVTFTFPEPVKNLTFVVGGLDKNQNEGAKGFEDAVVVSPSPSAVTHANTTGDATAGSPLVASVDGTVGSARVTIAGPVQTVRIVLSNTSGKNGKGDQTITVSDMTYLGDLKQY